MSNNPWEGMPRREVFIGREPPRDETKGIPEVEPLRKAGNQANIAAQHVLGMTAEQQKALKDMLDRRELYLGDILDARDPQALKTALTGFAESTEDRRKVYEEQILKLVGGL